MSKWQGESERLIPSLFEMAREEERLSLTLLSLPPSLPPSLVSKWQGESERLVRSLFEMTREEGRAIIFIDKFNSPIPPSLPPFFLQ